MFRCSIKIETLLGQGKVYRGAQTVQHCLGERGKGGKIKADRVNCPKNFVLHCSLCDIGVRGVGGGGGGATGALCAANLNCAAEYVCF